VDSISERNALVFFGDGAQVMKRRRRITLAAARMADVSGSALMTLLAGVVGLDVSKGRRTKT
jgi:hypothetical protein